MKCKRNGERFCAPECRPKEKIVKLPSTCSDHNALLCLEVADWTRDTVQYFEKYVAGWDDWIKLEKGFEVCDEDRIRAVAFTSSQADQRLEEIPGNASTLIQHNFKVNA